MHRELERLIADESNPECLPAAAVALGDSEQESAVVLGLYRDAPDASVQKAAIRALRRLDDYPSVTEAMLEILEDRLDAAATQ